MDRFKKAEQASILGIIGNIILLILKGTIGLFTNSQAMIADAANSASDIFSSLMTFIGNKIASRPSDADHNLGHGKAEYIYSLLISITMIILGLTVATNSIKSLINKEVYTFSIGLIIICIITIIIKFSLYLYTRKIAKEYNNLLVKANCKDHRNDTIITSINLLSIILGSIGITYFDSLVGFGISIWIVLSGIEIFKESYDVLMDKSIDNETKELIFENLKNLKTGWRDNEKLHPDSGKTSAELYKEIHLDPEYSSPEERDILGKSDEFIEKTIDKRQEDDVKNRMMLYGAGALATAADIIGSRIKSNNIDDKTEALEAQVKNLKNQIIANSKKNKKIMVLTGIISAATAALITFFSCKFYADANKNKGTEVLILPKKQNKKSPDMSKDLTFSMSDFQSKLSNN